MAVTYLAELGHQRIGYVGIDIEADTALRRRQGYEAGLASAGLPGDPSLIVDAPATIEALQITSVATDRNDHTHFRCGPTRAWWMRACHKGWRQGIR